MYQREEREREERDTGRVREWAREGEREKGERDYGISLVCQLFSPQDTIPLITLPFRPIRYSYSSDSNSSLDPLSHPRSDTLL